MSWTFDATQVAPQEAFKPIPAADYNMAISGSEMKPTKDGLGWYLELKLTVLDGAHKGRIIFDRLNLGNSNETAVRIAQQTLSAICHATGVMKIDSTSIDLLHNKPMLVAVKIKPASGQYEEGNEVKGYGAISGFGQGPTSAPAFVPQAAPPVAPVAPVAPPAPPVPAPVAGAPTPPWMRQG